MEIIRADNSGFCFGVKKALETTQDQIKESKASSSKGSLFTCGPLIHNKIVTSQLENDGVRIIKTPDEAKEGDTIIVRSHGEPKAFYDRMDELNLNYVDTTCPFVSKIHTIVNGACKEGKKIIIIGDANHQEVIATNGWCDNSAYIINSPDEVEKVESGEYLVVCQTTIRKELFESIIDALEAKGCKLEIKNTICNATSLRQDACQRLAKEVDAMII
ncbi:MAG: 4-hydroxy-3-methylbut-2-enyl diphosphate reductase, partial [[Eubacterium] sulci]|nr:4-hydroxy-3-methylbut-2-enyl diphosphate reductase [[Eubacterium] sulci]